MISNTDFVRKSTSLEPSLFCFRSCSGILPSLWMTCCPQGRVDTKGGQMHACEDECADVGPTVFIAEGETQMTPEVKRAYRHTNPPHMRSHIHVYMDTQGNRQQRGRGRHTHTQRETHTLGYAHTNTYMHTHICAHTHTETDTHGKTHTHTHTHT